MRRRIAVISLGAVAVLFLLIWVSRPVNRVIQTPASSATDPTAAPSPSTPLATTVLDNTAPTEVVAHNLLLRKGPSFRIYVRWLRGQMTRARRGINPSFDQPDSFYLDIKTGVIRANIGDLANYLNVSGLANSPLKNVTLSGDGDQIKLRGTLHKLVSLPIELVGTLSTGPNNSIKIHVTKLNLLKVPFKGMLGGLHITLADLFHPQGAPGIQVSGNDILLDTQALLPPPHIRGLLTSVRIQNPDIEEIYGNAQSDVTRVEQWRNFLRLREGTIDFGKLTMHHVDLIMIDISQDAWFDLDLSNYQTQLVNGYTRMTPEAGLQIFMPDLENIPHSKANQNISIDWLKNRNLAPPPEVPSK